jgi:hypothetical protein
LETPDANRPWIGPSQPSELPRCSASGVRNRAPRHSYMFFLCNRFLCSIATWLPFDSASWTRTGGRFAVLPPRRHPARGWREPLRENRDLGGDRPLQACGRGLLVERVRRLQATQPTLHLTRGCPESRNRGSGISGGTDFSRSNPRNLIHVDQLKSGTCLAPTGLNTYRRGNEYSLTR